MLFRPWPPPGTRAPWTLSPHWCERASRGFIGTMPHMNEAIVVLGAGQAAAQLAISLRQGGHSGPIRVIGEEPYLPYQRPPLSKKFLAEYRDPDSLFLRPESYWREQNVTFDLGVAAGAVDPRLNRVKLVDGREIDYGALVFATGT